MHARFIAATFAMLFLVAPASAQTTAPAKPDTNCTPSARAEAPPKQDQTSGSTAKSMEIGKSAILPSASGHANSAAPTVQNNGEPMEARPNCPPDQTKK
ncbi:hypothetical protein [Bradyrhizobium sp. LHD-71]|uniref:hypothetical protein n=1 Tax=Bradyrhizobium sp. LHD-71 TaxID=3072141 RepID=UPI00280FBCE6|nr:hypothetical protein [Bradyrhizobium sp. LHD-71]MDQ8730552.1 hypothetical protein [Bradyrhizobium sp. LHD-71]